MTVNEYLKLPYHYTFHKDGKYWYVWVEELRCYAYAKTMRLAYIAIRKEMKCWIEDTIKYGFKVPLPKEE
jgi:predicted RNase H-like HicB family nuclease